MPRTDRTRVEPSAPPIHTMPRSSMDLGVPPRDQSPPPRYEDIIGPDERNTFQQNNNSNDHPPADQSDGLRRSSRRIASNSRNASQTTNSTQPSPREGSSHRRPRAGRGSASPTGPAAGSRPSRAERTRAGSSGEKEKKKRGSKIKKGLENIAFSIIQLLD